MLLALVLNLVLVSTFHAERVVFTELGVCGLLWAACLHVGETAVLRVVLHVLALGPELVLLG